MSAHRTTQTRHAVCTHSRMLSSHLLLVHALVWCMQLLKCLTRCQPPFLPLERTQSKLRFLASCSSCLCSLRIVIVRIRSQHRLYATSSYCATPNGINPISTLFFVYNSGVCLPAMEGNFVEADSNGGKIVHLHSN